MTMAAATMIVTVTDGRDCLISMSAGCQWPRRSAGAGAVPMFSHGPFESELGLVDRYSEPKPRPPRPLRVNPAKSRP